MIGAGWVRGQVDRWADTNPGPQADVCCDDRSHDGLSTGEQLAAHAAEFERRCRLWHWLAPAVVGAAAMAALAAAFVLAVA